MGHKRTIKIENGLQGSKKKSFIKVLYSPKDRGITFLSLENQMWREVIKADK